MQYNKNDPVTIQKMFGSIAKSYDRTNAILSFQMHRHWNKVLVDTVLTPGHSREILDLCCGTGEIALTHLRKRTTPCQVHLLDFCSEMLQCAKEKITNTALNSANSYHYHQADAQIIPLPDNAVDRATIAYGIRNVKDPNKCIRDVYRVLRPGGTFGILELTRPTQPVLRLGHHLYLRSFLPILGWCFSANKEAYRYLCQSIHHFVKPDELQVMMQAAGFKEIKIIPLTGGIATILFAKKK